MRRDVDAHIPPRVLIPKGDSASPPPGPGGTKPPKFGDGPTLPNRMGWIMIHGKSPVKGTSGGFWGFMAKGVVLGASRTMHGLVCWGVVGNGSGGKKSAFFEPF